MAGKRNNDPEVEALVVGVVGSHHDFVPVHPLCRDRWEKALRYRREWFPTLDICRKCGRISAFVNHGEGMNCPGQDVGWSELTDHRLAIEDAGRGLTV